MGIKNFVINVFKRTDFYKNNLNQLFKANNLTISDEEKILLKNLGVNVSDLNNDIKGEVTYFTCMKVLSENMGKLPLKLYQETKEGVKLVNDDNLNMIRLRPNPYMTATTFWGTMENCRNHYGNAYAYLNFQGSKLKDMWILHPDNVRVMIDNGGYFGKDNAIWYVYYDPKSSNEYVINKDNILHVKSSNTYDGIVGISVRDILFNTIEGSLEQQNFLNNLYKNGMTGKAVLQYTEDLDDKAVARLVKGIQGFANGSSNAGQIIPLEYGLKITPLDLKLTDAQFADLKKYNSLQIAAAFGISPNFINDYSKSSYSNSEMQQLSFLVNTLQYILTQYEQEITYKLLSNNKIKQGYYFKFNEGALLRTDLKTQAEIIAMFTNNGIKTANECRLMLNMPTRPDGDKLIVNGNFIPLDMVGKQYMKGGENINEKQQE
nr:phage portal protein [[Eubacterium] tenue]